MQGGQLTIHESEAPKPNDIIIDIIIHLPVEVTTIQGSSKGTKTSVSCTNMPYIEKCTHLSDKKMNNVRCR